MFCPTSGWLCCWQDLWVWPSDTDHLMSSPLWIFHSPTWSEIVVTPKIWFILFVRNTAVYILLNDPLWVCYLCKFDWFKQTLRNFHLVSKFQSKYWQTEKAKKKWNLFSVLVPMNEFDACMLVKIMTLDINCTAGRIWLSTSPICLSACQSWPATCFRFYNRNKAARVRWVQIHTKLNNCLETQTPCNVEIIFRKVGISCCKIEIGLLAHNWVITDDSWETAAWQLPCS